MAQQFGGRQAAATLGAVPETDKRRGLVNPRLLNRFTTHPCQANKKIGWLAQDGLAG
jgi:hypothetical protein